MADAVVLVGEASGQKVRCPWDASDNTSDRLSLSQCHGSRGEKGLLLGLRPLYTLPRGEHLLHCVLVSKLTSRHVA